MSANHGGKDYNALSIFLKSSFKQVQTHPVPRQCFFPIPGIDSVLVHMERLEKTFLYSESDRSLIRKIFTQRRKQISSLVKKEKSEIRERLENWLLTNQIAGNLRPEQISAEKWQTLAEN
jgi:16S rRNA (adenine1518-N6/adenine1519-N6)-dimethyltransferase